MWPEISYWLGLVAIGVMPGWVLLKAAGIQWHRTELLAAAPGLSIAGVAICAYLAEWLGLAVNPWSALGLLALCAAGLYGIRRRQGAPPRSMVRSPIPEPWICWLVFACPLVVFLVLQSLRDVVILPPTVDDGVHHATWVRLIFQKETLSPAAIYAPPISDNQPVLYPWGAHVWIALLAKAVSLEWIETYWRSVLAIGSCIPLSVYALASRILPKGWPSLAAALCSLLFFWLPFQPYLWGGLSLLAGAVCALPIARVAIDAAATRPRAPMIMVAGVGVGLLLVHPSQALGALFVVALVTTTQWLDRTLTWRVPAFFLGVVTILGIVFTIGADYWQPLNEFVVRAEAVALKKAPSPRMVLWWMKDLFLGQGHSAPILGALCGLGVIAAIARPALRVALWMHLGLLALLPLALARTWLTALWYHDLERLWYLQLAAAPLLAAAGLVGLVELMGRLPFRRLASLGRAEVMWPLGLAVVAGGSHPYVARVSQRLKLAQRTMASDQSHLDDFAWIRANLPEDALILNAPGDWGLVLPFTGRPLTFANCQVTRSVAEHFWAFWALHDVGSYDGKAHERIRALGVRYVYAGHFREFGVPTHRGPTLDSKGLALNPGLERLYESRTAQIYHLREQLAPNFLEVDLSLNENSPADFQGFYPVEQQDGRAVRWTTGRSTIRFPDGILPASPDCSLVLGMRRPQHFSVDVSWDGRPLRALVEGVYAIPPKVHVLEIRSRTFTPSAVDDPSQDDRRLGVQLTGLSLECRDAEGADVPARTVLIPLAGSADARFHRFHALERRDGSTWRWTKERSVVYLTDQVLPKGKHCVVNLAVGSRSYGSAMVSWNGLELTEQTPGTFPLNESRGMHRLVLSSKLHQRPGDPRTLGIGLWRLGFHCPAPTQR